MTWACWVCCYKPRARVLPRREQCHAFYRAPIKPGGVRCGLVKFDAPDLVAFGAQLRLVSMLWETSRPEARYRIVGEQPPTTFDESEALMYIMCGGAVVSVSGRPIDTAFTVVGTTCRIVSTFDRTAGSGAFARVLAKWRLAGGQ